MTTKQKAISAKEVSELRQRTGAGMMDCKKALEETGGDMEAAIELLRKSGAAKAEKRVGRGTSEGLHLAKRLNKTPTEGGARSTSSPTASWRCR